jgi:hypothetical protein
MEPGGINWVQQILLPLLAIVIMVVGPWLGGRYVNTDKRKAQAVELDKIADGALSMIRLNNSNMPLLDHVKTYKDQLFKALMGNATTTNSVAVNKRVAADAIVRALNEERKVKTPFTVRE